MGNLFALLTGLVWAVAVIFLRRAGETVSPFALTFFRVACSLALLLPTAIALGAAPWSQGSPRDIGLLAVSGIVGIAVSDTLFHASLNRVGAGISSIVDCLYSPLTVLFAWQVLEERLAARQLLGMALVVVGVLTAAQHEPPRGVPRRQLVAGIVLGVVAMIALALGIVIAKPVLDHSGVIWATTVRQLGCLAALVPAALLPRQRREVAAAFRPTPSWRFALPGAFFGSYLSLLLWIAGMKYTQVGVAAILNQSSTIYILMLAALFLHEPFTRKKLLAAAIAVAGIALVTI